MEYQMTYSRDLLKGKAFLVYGATGGAGSATCQLISQLGGFVTLIGRDPERVEKVRRSLTGGGHTREIEGTYHGVFHSAGLEYMASSGVGVAENFDRVFEPSVGIAFDLAQKVGARKSILKDGGSVVFMSSVAAVRGTSGMTIYGASKAAIEGLVKSAAVEWAPRRIRVNAIRAGGFCSPMHSRIAARATPEAMDEYERKHLLGFGQSTDVANLAVFLLSDLGRWLTGACIPLDGGYTCR